MTNSTDPDAGLANKVPGNGTPATLGLLLAGGQSRRMGGGDKGLEPVGGRPILGHAIDRLTGQCVALLLNANGDPERFADHGLPVVADGLPGFPGPLAGILAGLDWMAANRPDLEWMVSVAADTPFIPRDLVSRLHAVRIASALPLACAASGGRAHPTIALWPVFLRHDLRHALTVDDERKVSRWTARHGIAETAWPVEPIDPFFNANRPEDLAEAQRLSDLLGHV